MANGEQTKSKNINAPHFVKTAFENLRNGVNILNVYSDWEGKKGYPIQKQGYK
jgi:hypothetical protein